MQKCDKLVMLLSSGTELDHLLGNKSAVCAETAVYIDDKQVKL